MTICPTHLTHLAPPCLIILVCAVSPTEVSGHDWAHMGHLDGLVSALATLRAQPRALALHAMWRSCPRGRLTSPSSHCYLDSLVLSASNNIKKLIMCVLSCLKTSPFQMNTQKWILIALLLSHSPSLVPLNFSLFPPSSLIHTYLQGPSSRSAGSSQFPLRLLNC